MWCQKRFWNTCTVFTSYAFSMNFLRTTPVHGFQNSFCTKWTCLLTSFSPWTFWIILFYTFNSIRRQSKHWQLHKIHECFAFKNTISILSFHSNVKGEEGERWWSHFWHSFLQLLKLFWFICTKPFSEGAGSTANYMPVLIHSIRPRGASVSQGDSLLRMLLSWDSSVHTYLWFVGHFLLPEYLCCPLPSHLLSTSLKGLNCWKIQGSHGFV